jgi:hypothetical protein
MRLAERVCHALSLDDERTTFHPVLYSEINFEKVQPRADNYRYVQDERLSQVWFSGVHSNVGGGYPDDSLAHVSLYWIMKEAECCGLKFKIDPHDTVRGVRSAVDYDGRLYDSRQGFSGYYRYGPRKLEELCHKDRGPKHKVTIDEPKIHESVFERIRNGAHAYAPIVLPRDYAVVNSAGQILDLDDPNNPSGTRAQANARADIQEHVWNLVWWRRIVYFLTLVASFYLAAFPFSSLKRSPKFPVGSAFFRPASAWSVRGCRTLPVGGSTLTPPIRAGLPAGHSPSVSCSMAARESRSGSPMKCGGFGSRL